MKAKKSTKNVVVTLTLAEAEALSVLADNSHMDITELLGKRGTPKGEKAMEKLSTAIYDAKNKPRDVRRRCS